MRGEHFHVQYDDEISDDEDDELTEVDVEDEVCEVEVLVLEDVDELLFASHIFIPALMQSPESSKPSLAPHCTSLQSTLPFESQLGLKNLQLFSRA